MAGMKGPTIPEEPPAILQETELKRLTRTCTKKLDFTGKRDLAIMRILLGSGIRRQELAGLDLQQLDLENKIITVLGKGQRTRLVPISNQATAALRRYIQARSKHTRADEPQLWLGHQGPITANGIYQMIRRRARAAGISKVHPHRFRHTWAHNWLRAGGSEADAMAIAGWRSRESMDRYIKSEAVSRAISNYRRIQP